MLRLAADENFNNNILRGVNRRNPSIDVVRVQDAGLISKDDPTILEWAAQVQRVILTHDVSTMTRHAYKRVEDGKPMPGVFEIARHVAIRVAIEEIILLAECSLEGEWEGQVRYLPLLADVKCSKASSKSEMKKDRWPMTRLRWGRILILFIVLPLLLAYVGSYAYLSRRGMRQAEEAGLMFWFYVRLPDAEVSRNDLNRQMKVL